MARSRKSEYNKSTYAWLLELYPGAFRQQFGGQMHQLFNDLCNERSQANQRMLGFLFQTYIETIFGAFREHAVEFTNKTWTNRQKLILKTGAVSLLAIAPVFVMLNNQSAKSIPPFSLFEQAKDLSSGKKDACLPLNQHAINAIENDDGIINHDGSQSSKFYITASTGIIDIPATVDYKIDPNSYQNGIAKGSIVYENGYGAYNFVIEKKLDAGEWQLISIIACENNPSS